MRTVPKPSHAVSDLNRERWVDTREAAALAGVKFSTIASMVDEGRVDSIRVTAGGSRVYRFIDVESIARYLARPSVIARRSGVKRAPWTAETGGAPRTFALEPLLDACRRAYGRESITVVATRFGQNGTGQVYRAMYEGGLTESHADRWACAAGFHPAEVWGQLWWDTVSTDNKDAAA